MKKTTKGAIAAAASATLLLGGAGSLAYWNTTDTVTAGAFNTGDLVLDFDDCDAATWQVTNAIESVTTPVNFNLNTQFVVPGDVFTKTCEIPITAIGENLRATLAITGGGKTFSPGLVEDNDVTIDSAFLVGADSASAVPVTEITDDNDGDTLFVSITVDFPIEDETDVDGGGLPVPDNGSKNQTLTLTDYVVTATQVRS